MIVPFKVMSYKLLTSEKNHLLQGTGLDDMEVICFFQTFTKYFRNKEMIFGDWNVY